MVAPTRYVRSRGGAAAAGQPPPARAIVRVLLLVFAFSIPIESLLKSALGTEATLSRFTGYAFFAAVLLFAPRILRRSTYAFWYFLAYLAVAAVRGALLIADRPQLSNAVAFYLAQRAQLLVAFFLLAALFADERLARRAMIAYALGGAVLAVAVLTSDEGASGLGRATAYGEDPNQVGGMIALAALVWIGIRVRRGGLPWATASWSGMAIMVAAVMATGSRGALVVFLIGGVILFAPRLRRRPLATAFAVAVIATVVSFLLRDSPTAERWATVAASRSLSERDAIYRVAFAMFLEKPLQGWGPVGQFLELGARAPYLMWDQPDAIGTHNTLLGVATGTGLLGLAPFVAGLIGCVLGGIRARGGRLSALPLAVVVGALTFGTSIDAERNKAYWFFLAVGAAFLVRTSRSADVPEPPTDPAIPGAGVPRPAGAAPAAGRGRSWRP